MATMSSSSAFLWEQRAGLKYLMEITGHDVIRTELTPPYKEILLRREGAHHRSTSQPAVHCGENGEASAWPKRLDVVWDKLGDLERYADTPEKVLHAWVNKFDFRTEDEAA